MMAELKEDETSEPITITIEQKNAHRAAVSRPSGIVILLETNQSPKVRARIRMISEKPIIRFSDIAKTSFCRLKFPVPCSKVRKRLMAEESDPVTSANMPAKPPTALLMP